jgi:hypothetical protein
MHELLLDGRLRQIFRDDGVLERLILLGVLKRLEDGLGCESMSERVPPGLPLSGLQSSGPC